MREVRVLNSTVGANPESSKIESYPHFDWLRFLLASIVVIGHENAFPLGPITGNLAVQVFFALSGWLIGGILIRTRREELPRFYFNRATRIWIPYLAAVILLYAIAAAREGINVYWWKYLFYDATFTHNIFTIFPAAAHEMPLDGSGNQFWSIAVEEQFYLFAPLVMLFLPFGKRLPVWIAIAALCIALQVNAAPIALGVIAAIAHERWGDWHLTRAGQAIVLAIWVLLLAALFRFHGTGFSHVVANFFSVCTVLVLSRPGRRRALPVFLGGISFPLYLNHWLGLAFVDGASRHILPMPMPLKHLAAYVFAVLVGAIAYMLIDRPVLQRRQMWFSRAVGLRLTATAYTTMLIGLVGGLLIPFR